MPRPVFGSDLPENQSSHKGTNMPHEITPANEHLEFLHSAIMKEVQKVIEQDSPFKFTASTLGLDCVSVARKVFQGLSARNLDDIVKGRKKKGTDPFLLTPFFWGKTIFAKNNLSKGNLFIQKHCQFTIFKGKKKPDRF